MPAGVNSSCKSSSRRSALLSRRLRTSPLASLNPSPSPNPTNDPIPSIPSPPHNQQPPSPDKRDVEQKRRDVGRLLSLFGRLALPYWRTEKSARGDLAALLFLALCQSGVSVGFSFISRDFYTALNTRNIDLFYHQAQLFFLALVVATPVVVYYQFLRDSCSLRWREWITSKVVSQYCESRNFYFLESLPSVDNPDQRISQDLNSFTTESIAFILTILVSSVDLVCFSFILFSIYPLLFGVLLVYAASGTVATAFVGKQLISLNYQQLVREADLRYSLVRMRENAESIAFFQGEKREQSEIMRRLTSTVENMAKVIDVRRRLSFLTTGYKFSIQVLPALVVGPRYFAGAIELGSVTQSFSAFSHILNDLSLVINRFDSLSQFGAGIDRLAEFVQALERTVQNEDRIFRADEKYSTESEIHSSGPASIRRVVTTESSLKVQDLTLLTPSEGVRRELVSNLSFELEKGKRMLVSAPSGFGKTSVLRAIAGLWENGSGLIRCPDTERMFFLPQKPYCTLGSLRQNILYPSTDIDSIFANDDEQILKILDKVDLAELPNRMGGLDAVADWADVLSLGEQQRLQFGRLIYRHMLSMCDVAIIDEGTSALSVEAEESMYGLVSEMGVTTLSVGHRPSLLQYHDYMLRLRKDGTGNWDFAEIKSKEKQQAIVQSL